MEIATHSPVLQIVHVSDIHINEVPQEVVEAKKLWMAHLFRWTGKVPGIRRLNKMWEQGTGGHDETALDEFTDHAKTFANDPNWSDVPTWMIDSGDLTTFGDDMSLDSGTQWLAQFASAPYGWSVYKLHGNHDTWPVMFPFLAGTSPERYNTLLAHRANLRNSWYKNPHPEEALPCAPASGGYEVQLFSFNSAVHDWHLNSFALGEVCHDQWWRHPEGIPQVNRQTADFHKLLGNLKNSGREPALRIAVLHHPVARAAYDGDIATKRLLRRGQFRKALSRKQGENNKDAIHVFLAGHTHRTFPALGDLNAKGCKPLTKEQHQLVIGTLSQEHDPEDNLQNGEQQQFQLLRIWQSRNTPGEFVLERHLYVRPNNIGDFQLQTPVESIPISV